MSNKSSNLIRLFAVIVLVLVLASATFAFAAANTVPTSNAGDGNAAISGYTITNIDYTLNTTNPAGNISSMTFTISPAVSNTTGQVFVSLDTGTTWVTCTTNVAGTTVTCPAAGDLGVTPLNATNLRVVAAQ